MKAGLVITGMQWQPAGQRSTFSVEHRLFVALTPLTAPDWIPQQSGNQPTSAPWPGGGQEQRFSAFHALLVATAPLATPTHWDQMLGSQAGVAGVTVPYTASC